MRDAKWAEQELTSVRTLHWAGRKSKALSGWLVEKCEDLRSCALLSDALTEDDPAEWREAVNREWSKQLRAHRRWIEQTAKPLDEREAYRPVRVTKQGRKFSPAYGAPGSIVTDGVTSWQVWAPAPDNGLWAHRDGQARPEWVAWKQVAEHRSEARQPSLFEQEAAA